MNNKNSKRNKSKIKYYSFRHMREFKINGGIVLHIYPPDEFYWKKDLKNFTFFRDNLDSDFHIFHEANFHDQLMESSKSRPLILTQKVFSN